MRVLVVGGGGREHAILHALSRSPRRPQLYAAPGNGGTGGLAVSVPIAAGEVSSLAAFVRQERIDLTVVGPEEPLVKGLVDALRADGRAVVGPAAAAARLEGSKAFAKAFMERYGIPTAAHRTFGAGEYDAALAYVQRQGAPIVIKADGLAAGKGAVVCMTLAEAREALGAMMRARTLGEAADRVVIEEYMEGEEATIFALCDGARYALLPPAQDHKRIGEGDTGPNTGGMGAYAPAPVATGALLTETARRVVEPVLAGMLHEGAAYTGFLYCGLMVTPEGPRVIEFNCRLGDPEAQAVLPLLQTDFLELMLATAHGELERVPVRAEAGAAACVVLAAPGYPGPYERGALITGLEAAARHALVFHAGTVRDADGAARTAGGRVLGLTGMGEDLPAALQQAYAAVEKVHFDGMQHRRDIGRRGLVHMGVVA